VVFQVWKAGQDVDSGIPVATIVSGIEGGVAKAVFKASAPPGDTVPDKDPEYFFSAHSAWCRYKKSGNAVVELKRPEITDLKWEKIIYDEQGNETGTEETDEIEYGKTVVICARLKDVEDGEYVNITVTSDIINFSETRSIEIKNGQGLLRFAIKTGRDQLTELTENDEVICTCFAETTDRRAKKKGEDVPIVFNVLLTINMSPDKLDEQDNYILEVRGGSYSQSKNVKDDSIPGDEAVSLKFDRIIAGHVYNLRYIKKGETLGQEVLREVSFAELCIAGNK
jgi:hypothetical protein